MSLVVCANQEQDGSTIRNDQSIYSAFSFRNTLSSTYKIPKNAQVALQSCKVNVDGRVVFSKNNNRFYQYLGTKLDRDGVTSPQLSDTTSAPVITTMLGPTDAPGEVEELSVNDFANKLQERMRGTTYHPNFKEKTEVEVLRNASSLDFLGYKTSFDANGSTANVSAIPADDTFENFFNSAYDSTSMFDYTGGVFTRSGSAADGTAGAKLPCVAICPSKPLSLSAGSFTVNISGATGRANGSGVPWIVGLSRYCNTTTPSGYYAPPYAQDKHQKFQATQPNKNTAFCDFMITRGKDSKLRVAHAVMNETGIIGMQGIKYFNASSDFTGNYENLAGKNYTDVRFTIQNEIVKAEIYDGGKGLWATILEYDPTLTDDLNFKPVNQSCWCMHPVLGVFSSSAGRACSLEITEFDAPPLTKYNPKIREGGGWFETLNLQGVSHKECAELESRYIIKGGESEVKSYTYKGLNASSLAPEYDPVLILDPSNVYRGTPGANGRQLLGYNNAIVDTPVSASASLKIFESDFAPSLTSSMAMFVRLNNFGQKCVNSLTGNNSKILAHLPRFDNTQTTGRLYFEPQNFVWLDLDNPAEMNINEFDISFCYVNEQYATVLTGQSIVCLYFREKPM